MAELDSVEAFQRSLFERFDQMKRDLDRLQESFSQRPDESQKNAAKLFADSATNLRDLLAPPDRPEWLTGLLQSAGQLRDTPGRHSAKNFLQVLVRHGNQVQPISFASQAGKDYDFDAIYRKYRDEERIPELFDELICALSDIISSGEVQVVVVLDALNELLNVLKANRNGSYATVHYTVWLAVYVRSLVGVYLHDSKVFGPFLKAYDKTVDKLQSRTVIVDKQMQDHTQRVLSRHVKNIERLQNTEPPPALPAPSREDDDPAEG